MGRRGLERPTNRACRKGCFVLLTLPIREVLAVTSRARVVKLALGGRTFPYRAGQALMIATHGQEKRRPYSIAEAPEQATRDDSLELLVGVDALGSPGPHLALEPDTLVDVEGPVGRFAVPDESDARRFVFIAGGTGIAPLRAMLRQALKTSHRQIEVFYSARTPADFAYEGELGRLAKDGRIELRQTVTRQATADWTGRRGRIGRADLVPLVHDPSTLYFICGPPAFVADTQKALDELAIPQDRIRVEEWLRQVPPALGVARGA
jgi:ferredoxin-NADP reductase